MRNVNRVNSVAGDGEESVSQNFRTEETEPSGERREESEREENEASTPNGGYGNTPTQTIADGIVSETVNAPESTRESLRSPELARGAEASPQLRRSKRIKKQSVLLRDFIL